MRRLVAVLTVTMPLVGAGAGLSAQTAPAAVAEAPLRMEDGRLVVSVTTASGAELDFLLTTSAPTTVLTESVREELGAAPKLELGGIDVPLENPMIVPDATLGADRAYAGMIAPDLLAEHDVLIDVQSGRLLLRPFGRQVSWPGTHLSEPIPLRVYHGVVLGLDVEVDGRTYPASLDLANAGLVVNAGVQSDLGLHSSDTATLTIGSASFAGLGVAVEDNPMLQRWSPNGDGFVMVGGSIAESCAIALSWIHQEMRTCVR